MDQIRSSISDKLGGSIQQWCADLQRHHFPPKPVIPVPKPKPTPEITPAAYKATQRKARTHHRERLERIRKEGYRGSLDQLRSQGR